MMRILSCSLANRSKKACMWIGPLFFLASLLPFVVSLRILSVSFCMVKSKSNLLFHVILCDKKLIYKKIIILSCYFSDRSKGIRICILDSCKLDQWVFFIA